jgi:hypothetical protein
MDVDTRANSKINVHSQSGGGKKTFQQSEVRCAVQGEPPTGQSDSHPRNKTPGLALWAIR